MPERKRLTFTGEGKPLLLLVLRPSRTVVIEVTATVAQGPPALPIGRSLWVSVILWREPVQPGRRVIVDIQYEGEAAEPVTWLWLDPDDAMVPDVSSRDARDAYAQSYREDVLRNIQSARHPGIAGVLGTADLQDFFAEFDLATNPALFQGAPGDSIPTVEEPFRCHVIAKTAGLLWTRVNKRGDDPSGVLPVGDAILDGVEADVPDAWVGYLSHVQIDVVSNQSVFQGTATSDYNWDALNRAFMLFATGNLEIPSVFCPYINFRPDSANVFLFAEFALLAIDRGVDTAFWSHLLNIFVCMQRLFLDTYADLNAPCKYPPDVLLIPVAEATWSTYTNYLEGDLPALIYQHLSEAKTKGFSIPMAMCYDLG